MQGINLAGILNAFRIIWNPSLALPHVVVNDIRNIHFGNLKTQGGIKAIGFDKDNCLTAPYVLHIHPPFEADKVEESLGVPVLRHTHKKPAGGEELKKHLNIPSSEVAFVGDRVLTDVIYGNLNGNFTIWTRQIITEHGDNKAAIVVRRVEDLLLKYLQKLGVKPPEHTALRHHDAFTK
ncbi:hypothetical protein EC973_008452 [Apophysomyces ossiformis]|uniref:Uncharacterized protein n=1 Tax=Apophysomyces ossiformis TaxID=679940 RepID=A0A8H7BMY9_9FUNG|nr:hypothetical protein EC973_008452 [Apophysomyces ossiformis]